MEAPSTIPGLKALFDVEPHVFAEHYWLKRSLFHAGAPSRLGGLIDLPTGDIDAILHQMRYDGPIRADMWELDGRRMASLLPTVEDAAKLYRAGHTIYIRGVRSPAFLPWQTAIERELSLPPGLCQVHCFVSRRGRGFFTHFDKQDNIAVQVAGAKRWRVAPNDHVLFPTINGGVDIAEHREASRPLPSAMPEGSETVEMTPGAALYFPRGHWHDTETVGDDSFHIILTMQNPTRMDLLQFLLTMLPALKQPEWRESVRALWQDGAVRPEAVVDVWSRFGECLAASQLSDVSFAPEDVEAALKAISGG